MRDYLAEIQRVDIDRVDGRRRDPDRVSRLVRSLACNVATHAAATTLAADTGGAEGPLKDDTVREYLAALERLMIVEDQPAWSPRMRSRTALRSAAKRHFVDPSLAVAALDSNPDRLLRDLETLGFLFVSLGSATCASTLKPTMPEYSSSATREDLRSMRSSKPAPAHGWRSRSSWVKGRSTPPLRTLLRFASKVDTHVAGPPAMLGVITAAGYAYQRRDGVAVVPIGALGP